MALEYGNIAKLAVPTADVTTNVDMRDVVGNKTDAAVTTVGTVASLIAYIKGLLGAIYPRLPSSGTLSTLVASDVPLAVPTADASTNTNARDVTGNKTDAAVTTVGTVATIIAYVKGLLGYNLVPAADATTNTTMRDVIGNKADISQTVVTSTTSIMSYIKGIRDTQVIPGLDTVNNSWLRDVVGNKTDALVTDVASTKSIIAYVKGLIQELDQRKIAKCVAASTTNGNTAPATVISITDKGVLTGISQIIENITAGKFWGTLIITIDGTVILTDAAFSCANYVATYNPTAQGNNSLAFNHRFNTSLLVQHHVSNEVDNYATVYTKVAYTVDD